MVTSAEKLKVTQRKIQRSMGVTLKDHIRNEDEEERPPIRLADDIKGMTINWIQTTQNRIREASARKVLFDDKINAKANGILILRNFVPSSLPAIIKKGNPAPRVFAV
ncbi:hypothetical protein Trydic_g4158 [Trypoxylus dichotomus]